MPTQVMTGAHTLGTAKADPVPNVVCPQCGHRATFEVVAGADIQSHSAGGWTAGLRRCPNVGCHSLVFFVRDALNGIITTFPPRRIDFDRTNLPEKVLAALEEAITCHANECYVASAIMIRKTLERLCEDQKATGKDLRDRLKALAAKIVVPVELVQAMDELRLLGNDAAHVEAKVFDEIGKDEVETGLDLAKELLKAVYQLSALLKKLQALKKT